MPLATFLDNLLETGQVTVASQLAPFAAGDLAAATARLRAYHAADARHLPGTAPAFEPEAAQWAAVFLYRTMQLAFLRDYDEAAVTGHLADWPGPVTPETSYAVDLTFRYLPALLGLARGLAPADVLVARLQAMARQWPLSFVGVPLADAQAPPLPAHPALRGTYLDRIIEHRDRARAARPEVAAGVREALGTFAAELWPDMMQGKGVRG
ncbi:MAG: hypothetical protein ACRYFX_23365 [Janthinobacterium lividum]